MISGIIFEDQQSLHPKYTVTGPSGTFTGVALNLIEIDQAGAYTLQLSLPSQEKILKQSVFKLDRFEDSPMVSKRDSTSLTNLSSTPTRAQVLLGVRRSGKHH